MPWAAVFGADAVGVSRTCTPVPRAAISAGSSHTLALSLNVVAGTAWSTEEVRAAAIEAAVLLGQCGIHVARIELCSIDAPRRFHFYSDAVSRELLRQLAVPKPAVFFVEDTLNEPAHDAEAIGRSNATMRPELADTVWVAFGARDLPHTLAHELVHVLSDSGRHSELPYNLMRAYTSPLASRLTEDQCTRLRLRATANGLLQVAKP